MEAGRRMVAEGADVLDVGGQSTRPTSQLLPAEEEAERVVPVIRWVCCPGAYQRGQGHDLASLLRTAMLQQWCR